MIEDDLENAVSEWKKEAKLSNVIDIRFHTDKVLLLCPDLVTLRQLLGNSSCDSGLASCLENLESAEKFKSWFTIPKDPVTVNFSGSVRPIEFHILSLRPQKDYFLFLDQRPLANLFEVDMTDEDMLEEQTTYYNHLEDLVKKDAACDKRLQILRFSGRLSLELEKHCRFL